MKECRAVILLKKDKWKPISVPFYKYVYTVKFTDDICMLSNYIRNKKHKNFLEKISCKKSEDMVEFFTHELPKEDIPIKVIFYRE